MDKVLFRLAAYSIIIASLAGCAGNRAGPDSSVTETDRVDFSFVFFGCNRIGWDKLPENVPPMPSTANVPQLEQTLKDIAVLQKTAGLKEPPRYLFLLGDIVRNESDDKGQTLVSELNAWQALWNKQPFATSGIQPVLIPGNHEVLKSIKSEMDGHYNEIPNPYTYEKWLSWLSDNNYNRMAGNGPTPTGSPADRLVLDNRRLTWSFSTELTNGKDAHFVLINTDSLSAARTSNSQCLQEASLANSPLPGWTPVYWIDKDLNQAQQDSNTDMIFAFGHKPIYSPNASDSTGRETILNCDTYPQANLLQKSFQGHSKFVAYLAAHLHQWDYTMLGDDEKRKIPQVVAGNGGSPLSGGNTFGFTLVKVFTSGKVTATRYGREAPEPYYSEDSGGTATARETVVLRQAKPLP